MSEKQNEYTASDKKTWFGAAFQQASFGLEKESQRVYQDGSVVTTPHPKCFGNRSYHPYIQTDLLKASWN